MVGDLYIRVIRPEGSTRIVHPSLAWLQAVADVLRAQGEQVSSLASTVTIHFDQSEEEQARVDKLLDLVVKAKGGLSIVDLTS